MAPSTIRVDPESLVALQADQARIRNVCILAHVDHGKTTLSDHLIASNGLIHPRLAGELRFLDSREEEQARGITMKSSSISLLWSGKGDVAGGGEVGAAGSGGGGEVGAAAPTTSIPHLINLIDSPGHVDFCSEVSTATRLTDGAIVVIDAVEGVCSQTVAVLRAAWEERVAMMLFLNKVDRLVLELGLSPAEAHARLRAVVAHANMVVSSFASERFISRADAMVATEAEAAARHERQGEGERPHGARGPADPADQAPPEDDRDVFDPVGLGNVVFGSAGDGWAFSLADVAARSAPRLGAKPAALARFLWGDYSLDAKTRRVVPVAPAGGARAARPTLFSALALEPVWKLYAGVRDAREASDASGPKSSEAAAAARAAVDLMTRAAGSLGLALPPRALREADLKGSLRALLQAWMPASDAVLGAAVASLPGPAASAAVRMERLVPGRPAPGEREDTLDILEALGRSDPSPLVSPVAYVSKMVAVPSAGVPPPLATPPAAAAWPPPPPELERFPEPSRDEADDLAMAGETFLAFGRVFAGTIRDGQWLLALPYDHEPRAVPLAEGGGAESDGAAALEALTLAPGTPARPAPAAASSTPLRCQVRGVYLMMGQGLVPVATAPAGAVVALGGLGRAVLKSATLAGSPLAPALCQLRFQSQPIVRVAVEPADAADHGRLLRGLALLERADPLARVETTLDGESLLSVAGEVHLETAVADLRNRFARCDILISPPVIAFRESVAERPFDAAASLGAGAGAGAEHDDSGGASAGGARPSDDPPPLLGKIVEVSTSDGLLRLRARACALPGELATLLEQSGEEVALALGAADGAGRAGEGGAVPPPPAPLSALGTALRAACEVLPPRRRRHLLSLLSHAVALGPGRSGPNLVATAPASLSLFRAPPEEVVEVARKAGAGAGARPASASALDTDADADALDGPTAGWATGEGGSGTGWRTGRVDEVDEEAPGLTEAAPQETSLELFPPGSAPVARLLGMAGGRAGDGPGDAPAAGRSADGPPSSSLPASLLATIAAGALTGAEAALQSGPLCGEPMWGVAFELECALTEKGERVLGAVGGGGAAGLVTLGGAVTPAATSAVRAALRHASPRIVEAQLLAEVTVPAEGLAAVYAVLGRRKARVLSEEAREGSGLFAIAAHLPAEAAFGFASELRVRASGGASASLALSHWQRLEDDDPFFVPTTEEEREEFGEEGQGIGASSRARRLIDATRERRGLALNKKVVEFATKQRTRARKV